MRSLLFITGLLCSFLSFASASITLSSNFQAFSGTSNDAISESNCRALYNSRIEKCTDTVDFLNGNYCTVDCQQALLNMEAKLNNFCKGVEAESGSLLAAIFGRKLVESICRDGGATGPQSSPRISTTTKPVSTKTMQTTVTTATEDGGASDAESTPTLQVTSSASVTVTISSSSGTLTTFVPLPTPTTQQSAPAATTITWREKARQDQACAILQGGGGSPFDNMVNFNFPLDSKSRQQQLRDCEVIAAQRTRELKRKKSAGEQSKKPSCMVVVVIGVGIGLMLLA